MRIGAIFARGSCRALKWTALLGVVFALVAGTAAAQNTTGVTITGPTGNKVSEGSTATYTVAIRGYVDTAENATTPRNPTTVSVTLATPSPDTDPGATEGEPADLNSNAHILTVNFEPPNNSSTTNRLLYTASKTISVVTLGDNDAEDEHFTLAFSISAGSDQLKRIAATTGEGSDANIALAEKTGTPATHAANPGILIIDDTETQGYTLTLKTTKPKEATAFTVELTASPEHEDGTGTLQVNIDKDSGWTLAVEGDTNPTTVGATDENKAITLTITQAADKNRVTDTVIVSAHKGTIGKSTQVASLSVDVADINALQAVTAMVVDKDGVALKEQPKSVAEGETIKIAVMPVDDKGKAANAMEALEIALAPSGTADVRDYRLGGAIKITSGQRKSNVVDLIVTGDDDDVGMEMLVLDATVSGEKANGTETKMVAGVLSIGIEDKTMPQISAKDGAYEKIKAIVVEVGGTDGLNPGDTIELMTADLFTVMTGCTATYGTSVEGGAVTASSSGDTITITAVKEGESKVTITGTVSCPSSFKVDQTVSNSASITFPVMVADTMLTVMVAADPMEIMEGAMSTITATANRAVTEADGEVKIDLEVVGDGGTLDMDSIMIAAGMMSGSAMLTAAEDDDYDDETVTVIASGSGITGNMQVAISVMDNDEAPVAEPTISAKDGAAMMIADAISKAAGDADWMVGGMVATVDMSMLFDVDDGVTATYSGVSSDEMVVSAVTTGGTMLALTPMGAGMATITVTGTDTGGGGSATVMHDAMVALQTLMVTVTADSMAIDEGGMATITAAANRNVTADTMLSLTVTGDTAAVEVADMLTIPAGMMTGTATVMAVQDDDTADANVTVVASGHALGSDTVSLSFAITDDDRTVVAKSQAEVTAMFTTAVAAVSTSDGWLPGGDAAMVDMSMLFDIEDGAMVEYTAESSADMVGASVSGSMLTLTPMDAGGATITVMATDTAGDADDHAMVMGDVEVGVLPLMVTLSGPADMNLVEGMSYELTAMANRAVMADTMVEIMRDRAMSDADDYDFTVEAITIEAGGTMGKTMLMVKDDGMDDSGAGMPEALVLYGMVGNMQTNSLSFNIWDAAVPALPVIAQLLLAAFLAIGGYRRYLRR